MCGRYVIQQSFSSILESYYAESTATGEFQPIFNAAPSMHLPIIREEEGKRTGALHRWGLLPFWAKDEKLSYKLINARSETLSQKPSFREAYKQRRCVVPASGFYEWRRTQEGKVPHYIHATDGQNLTFAGLYEHWKHPDGKSIDSFTIITTDANRPMKTLHHRMPALLFEKEIEQWLDPTTRQPAELLRPAPDDAITFHAVSTKVNSPKNQGEALIDPV